MEMELPHCLMHYLLCFSGVMLEAGRGLISACVYMIVFNKEVECAPSACL